MINIETKNKLEQLEKKVEEMERQLKQKTTLENTVKEMEKRLMIYEDKIRSDKGEVTLKKNFVIKNRKGDVSGGQNSGNTSTMSFNERTKGTFNHIFIGNEGSRGSNRTNTIGLYAIKQDDLPNIMRNGTIQLMVCYTDDLDSKGVVSKGFVNLFIVDIKSYYGQLVEDGLISSAPDDEGIAAQLNGRGKDGFAALAHYEDTGVLNTAISAYKDNIVIQGIPTSDPSVAGAIYNDAGTLKISSG